VLEDPSGADLAAYLRPGQDAFLERLPQQAGMMTDALIDPAEIARAVLLLASPTMPGAVGANWLVGGGALKTP
jgi:hypothetical protein